MREREKKERTKDRKVIIIIYITKNISAYFTRPRQTAEQI